MMLFLSISKITLTEVTRRTRPQFWDAAYR